MTIYTRTRSEALRALMARTNQGLVMKTKKPIIDVEIVVSSRLSRWMLLTLLKRSIKADSVTKPTGSRLLTLAHFLLPKHAFENIVKLTIADMWEQQQEALANGEVWRYRWIGFRDQTRIVLALAIEPVSKVLFKIVSGIIPRS